MIGIRRSLIICALALTVLFLVSCNKLPVAETGKALAMPGLEARIDKIDEIKLIGAGGKTLVTLRKRDSVWHVVERGDWPAVPGLVDTALFALSKAHLAEEKTDQPRLYSRLGVESVSLANAQGMEVRLSGGGSPLTLVVGHEHPKLDGSYVRVEGQPRAWLTDVALTFERAPAGWIDRSLIDLPLARVAQVSVTPLPGKSFVLVQQGDRYWPQDAPAPISTSSHGGDALAGVLEHLSFDEVAADTNAAPIDRRLRFVAVDGRVVELQAWRVQGKIWARFSVTLDSARAGAWQTQAPEASARATVEKELAAWQQRFAGHAFELPAYQASILYTARDQIVAGSP